MEIRIRADTAKLEKAFSKKTALVRTAISQGLNEAGNKTRTKVQHALQDQTSLVRYNSVTKRTATLPSSPETLAYTLIVKGKPPTKPPEFRTTVRKGKGGGVTITMWQKAHKFVRSFQQLYKGGLRMRRFGPRIPIRGFDGPNLAKEAVKAPTSTTFIEYSEALTLEAVTRRLVKLLG